MNRKKIYKLLIAASTVVTTMNMATDYVYAAQNINVQAIKNVYATRTQNIMGTSEVSENSMKNFFNSLNIKDYKLNVSIDEFIKIAYEEASMEGVRGDIVVAQAFLETGYFKYGEGKAIVKPEDNNFAGIGATGQSNLRNTFNDVREGLRAQVQHLKAYASTALLKNPLVDPRFNYVTRGSAETLADLSGKWAYPGYNTNNYNSLEAAFEAGDTYGQKIYSIIEKASNINNTTVVQNNSQLLAVKGQAINVSTNLRIRQSPSTNSTVLGYISKDQMFDIKGKNGDWYNIGLNNTIGYVHKDYVREIIANIPIPSVTSNDLTKLSYSVNNNQQSLLNGQVINVSSNLRIRQAASTNSAIMGYLVNGQTFTIKGKNGDWYNIQCGDKVGYINKNYVKELNTTISESNTKNDVTTIAMPKQIGNTTSNVSTENNNTTNNKQEKASKGKVVNISTNLRIRQSASSSAAIVGYLINGQSFTIKGKNGDWYNIQCGDKNGYIYKDYVKVIEDNQSTEAPKTESQASETSKPQINEVGTIYNVSSNLRLRSNPNTNSNSITLAYILPGQTFTILGLSGDWYNVNYNGKVGYLNKNYVKKVDKASNSSTNNSSSAATASKAFETVFSSLKAQIGSPYVFGGAGELLTSSLLDKLKKTFPAQAQQGIYDLAEKNVNKGYKAFDCSGFLQWGFKQAGITIGRTTWDQINNGTEVSLNNIKPGDILFYSDIQHVGMYIGDGKWIDSPNSRTTIKISDVPWNKIGRARRVIN